jgi:hypothetical protein
MYATTTPFISFFLLIIYVNRSCFVKIVIYPFGIPALFLGLLVKAQIWKRERRNHVVATSLQFLFEAYSTEAYVHLILFIS